MYLRSAQIMPHLLFLPPRAMDKIRLLLRLTFQGERMELRDNVTVRCFRESLVRVLTAKASA